jgi:hypothetical protein
MARRAEENDRPPGPLATLLMALWLYACILVAGVTTLHYLNVPVRTWLARVAAILAP